MSCQVNNNLSIVNNPLIDNEAADNPLIDNQLANPQQIGNNQFENVELADEDNQPVGCCQAISSWFNRTAMGIVNFFRRLFGLVEIGAEIRQVEGLAHLPENEPREKVDNELNNNIIVQEPQIQKKRIKDISLLKWASVAELRSDILGNDPSVMALIAEARTQVHPELEKYSSSSKEDFLSSLQEELGKIENEQKAFNKLDGLKLYTLVQKQEQEYRFKQFLNDFLTDYIFDEAKYFNVEKTAITNTVLDKFRHIVGFFNLKNEVSLAFLRLFCVKNVGYAYQVNNVILKSLDMYYKKNPQKVNWNDKATREQILRTLQTNPDYLELLKGNKVVSGIDGESIKKFVINFVKNL